MPYKDPIKASEYFKKYSKKWRELNPDRVKEYQIKNRERTRIKTNRWQRNNPEKILESQKKHIEKLGRTLNMNHGVYNYALISWSRTVRKRDKTCKICDSKEQLIAHHIFYKNKYPKLSLNSSNGITLCKKCHYKTHYLNG